MPLGTRETDLLNGVQGRASVDLVSPPEASSLPLVPLVRQPTQVIGGEGVGLAAEFAGHGRVLGSLGQRPDFGRAQGDEGLLHTVPGAGAVEGHALVAEDLDAFGALVARHWEINKRMDPGCSNPFIDDLLALCAPYLSGAKLAGAGGGGFALMVARDAAAAQELGEVLGRRFRGAEAGLWGCAIASPGLAGDEGV